ncbi:PP2C family protein-serine/threonine phosphatase [Streptomyces sp. NBC_01716]|uniref:PP2C family protein-serine/threonine phosphatase n=1 Tax=Streptomyces sp. NBC_01716 TaxID=2975917 RepID=UPI002E37C387|nr:PP2C family protein-serine/threonine phosphatase [Streptomyces sp. NBC_01716]
MPLTIVIAVPLIDLWLPRNLHVAPLLVVAPTITAAFAGPRLVAAIGGLAVLSQIVAGLEKQALGDERVVLEVVSLVVVSALVTLFCYLRERHQAQLTRAQLVSETTQLALLRPLPPHAGPLSIASEYRSAEPDSRLGGDLFAVTRTEHSTRFLIGDVRGKGLTSLNGTSIMLGAFRATAHRQAPLPELAAYLEGSVHWGLGELDHAQDESGEWFVTALVADIPDDEQAVHVVNMGHPPPLMIHEAAATPLLVRRPAPPLGLGGLGEASYVEEIFPFRRGDFLLLYTDGVSEARDSEGDFYPLAERAAVAGRSAVWSDGGPSAMLQHLFGDLLSYAGGELGDDMAMIAVAWGVPENPAGAARAPGRA